MALADKSITQRGWIECRHSQIHVFTQCTLTIVMEITSTPISAREDSPGSGRWMLGALLSSGSLWNACWGQEERAHWQTATLGVKTDPGTEDGRKNRLGAGINCFYWAVELCDYLPLATHVCASTNTHTCTHMPTHTPLMRKLLDHWALTLDQVLFSQFYVRLSLCLSITQQDIDVVSPLFLQEMKKFQMSWCVLVASVVSDSLQPHGL